MPRPFPEPNLNQSSDLLIYANNITDGYTTLLFAFAMWVIVFIIMKSKAFRNSDSMLTASAITLILSSLLFYMGALAGKWIGVFIAALVLSLVYRYIED